MSYFLPAFDEGGSEATGDVASVCIAREPGIAAHGVTLAASKRWTLVLFSPSKWAFVLSSLKNMLQTTTQKFEIPKGFHDQFKWMAVLDAAHRAHPSSCPGHSLGGGYFRSPMNDLGSFSILSTGSSVIRTFLRLTSLRKWLDRYNGNYPAVWSNQL